MQKPEKRRELRLKKFWHTPRITTSSEESCGAESPTKHAASINAVTKSSSSSPQKPPTCSLPLLQVWPSADSPRGEADGQSFIFPIIQDDQHPTDRRNSLFCDQLHAGGDSGIDSIQASPSPVALPDKNSPSATPIGSPNPSIGDRRHNRRPSSALLHPDHARLLALRQLHTSPDNTSIEEDANEFTNGINSIQICTATSSSTSSLNSIAQALSISGTHQRLSDPWLHTQHHSLDKEQQSTSQQNQLEPERRRSSGLSGRLSLFDALDLEYALFRAAARGSVGPYSLTGSVHKLTFTQSLAFPNLARNMATKRRCSPTQDAHARPLNPNESGLNTCAKIATALILVAISFLVFFIVFKYVKT